MSVDINWETLTKGPDGQHLSEAIRDFIHDKFQEIPFPRFLQSVNVVSFDLGTIAPDIEIKDICEPYPEFYEDAYAEGDDEDEEEEDEEDRELEKQKFEREQRRRDRRERRQRQDVEAAEGSQTPYEDGRHGYEGHNQSSTPMTPPPYRESRYPGFRPAFSPAVDQLTSPPFARTAPNLHYFHSSFSPGFSGALTPLASLQQASPFSPPRNQPIPESPSPDSASTPVMRDVSSLTRMKNKDGDLLDGTREPPPTPFPQEPPSSPSTNRDASPSMADSLASLRSAEDASLPPPRLRLREPRDTDSQIVSHVRYVGDIRMEITAELLLDYPAPMFVSLPVRITITGVTFDGTAVLAYIRRRAHFCFVDDGVGDSISGSSGVGNERSDGGGGSGVNTWNSGSNAGVASMLKEIKIESEIGEKGRGKQVLKNVGKVERFVLERVRRILEEEFVFPSSWTFLL